MNMLVAQQGGRRAAPLPRNGVTVVGMEPHGKDVASISDFRLFETPLHLGCDTPHGAWKLGRHKVSH